ncbi:MAG: MFS transporter [Actinomycetales bacterium]|nr:MFS transporter [Actinomycetales bacterium]
MRPHWSNRDIEIVIFARVFMSVGRALAGIVTPIYLALVGFGPVELSVYVMVVAGTSALLSTGIGTLSDRVGRRTFLVVVPLFTALAGSIFATTASHPMLFVAGALGSFGRGAGAGAGAIGPYQPAESAYVTERVAPRHRNAVFGRLTFASSVGAAIGGPLALLVPSIRSHAGTPITLFRVAFFAIAVVSALAGIVALALHEVRRARTEHRLRPRFPRRSRWLLYRLWVTNTLNGAAVGMFGPFLTYWFYRRYGVDPGEVGVLYTVVNVATIASSLSAAAWARRWGLVRTVSVVRVLQSLLLVPMVLSANFEIAGAWFLVRMLIQRIGLPLRQSYVVGLADPDERASVAALSNLPSQVATAISPLLTGYLFAEADLLVPFEVAATLQLANALTFWAFFRRHPPDEEVAPVVVEGSGDAVP